MRRPSSASRVGVLLATAAVMGSANLGATGVEARLPEDNGGDTRESAALCEDTTTSDRQGTGLTLRGLAPTVEVEFEAYCRAWTAATSSLSSLADKIEHPTYKAIIEFGAPVLPLLFARLRENPDEWWYTALERITGKRPLWVFPRGSLAGTRNAWLRWGRKHGYGV